jgi:hypothetical protein
VATVPGATGAGTTGAEAVPGVTATTVAPTGIGWPGGITWVVPFGRVTVVVPGAGAELLWHPARSAVQSVAAMERFRTFKIMRKLLEHVYNHVEG